MVKDSKRPTHQMDEEERSREESPESGEKVEKDIPLKEMTKAQLIKKVEDVQAESEKNYDLYLRSQAEIENLKKRFQKDREELIKYSNESLVKQLLPVMDSLEKAVSHSNSSDALDAIGEGVALTLKELTDTLEKAGLKAVEAEGKPFDPNFHEAVSELEGEDSEPGVVLQELQKGYVLNERLIRPAMVIINKRSN